MFYLFLIIIIVQRVSELLIARRNEAHMKSMGGEEHCRDHYPLIVAVHLLFLLSFTLEVIVLNKEVSPLWMIILPIILITQVIRYWAVFSLGTFWNTKIIIVPDLEVVAKGPYRFMRHPNYLVVAVEILFLPIFFQAYATAILFTVLNAAILTIRIPAEEKALMQHTDYKKSFINKKRFIPGKEEP
ncbi:isoprenylcysteine carboxyl methyltransferase family protein [Bacillus sp. V2I10]|uniref:isoprenylcysteine carboxyl methyltransferase family protein n=1 Tax=Bacillus sp. V2I10 TaxID=3042276 RepID=UPI0027D921B3|nr:isoprenylcysteine carboxylmethyltransferase family protein [Bacillus sp. V2I10]